MPRIAERALVAAGLGGWDFDVATRQLDWTATTFRIHDIDSPRQITADEAIEFLAPSARPVMQAAIESAIRDGLAWDLELPLMTARGRRVWVRSRGKPMREGGKTIRLSGVLEDVTARRKAVDQEARLALAARQTPNAVLILNRVGQIEWANDAFTRAYGFPLAEIHGSEPTSLCDGSATDDATLRYIADCIRDGIELRAELPRRGKDGVPRHSAISCTPIHSAFDTIEGFIWIETDVSARRAAEERARREFAERERTEALLQEVLDTLPTSVTAFDADNRLILANRASKIMFPISSQFAKLGVQRKDMLRLAAEHGQYPDAPTEPAAQLAWVEQRIAAVPDGTPRLLRLPHDRVVAAFERRSPTGTLVTIRVDVTDVHRAEETARREAAERERAEGLLRDILDALPVAVTAYDPDENFILTNETHAALMPIATGAARAGRLLEDVVTEMLDSGQFLDAPSSPSERSAWIADTMAMLRGARGTSRTMHLQDGRVTQVHRQRSKRGNLVVVRSDITELHAAEERALRAAAQREQAEALLRDVLDTLPVAVVAYDRDNHLVLQNRAHAELFGIALTLGMSAYDVARLYVQNGVFPAMKGTESEKEEMIAELVAHRQNPSKSIRTMPIAGGRMTQVRERRSDSGNLVIVRSDITDLHAAEAAALHAAAVRQGSESLLRDMLDALPVAVIAYDHEDRFILQNSAHTEMAGCCFIPGATLEDVIRFAVRSRMYTVTQKTNEEQEQMVVELLAYFRHPSTAPRTIPMPDGRVTQVRERRSSTGNLVVVRSDVTDLHNAEASALREAAERERAEALLRDVLDTLPNAVIAFDESERVILINRAYQEAFPIASRFALPGRDMTEMFRLSAQHGQYADLPTAPEEFEPYVHHAVDVVRTCAERTVQLGDGRFMQLRTRRSDGGTLVSVRTDVTELIRAEALLRDILETLPSGVIVYDRDERLLLWNSAADDLMPTAATTRAVGLPLAQMLKAVAERGQFPSFPDSPKAREQWFEKELENYRNCSGERTIELPGGRFVQARDRRSKAGHLVCVRTDTTELVNAQALLRDVLDALPSAVTAYDQDERLILFNRAYAELFPIAAKFSKLGDRLEDTLRLAADHGQFPDAGATPQARAAWVAKRLAMHRKPGVARTIALPDGRFVQARDSRSATGVTVSIRTDTTDLVHAESKMRIQAESDTLTGLANRTAFLASLERTLSVPAGRRNSGGALLLLDIDFFKQINDTLGHDAGDALLIEIAVRLRHHMRESDVPARLGGDEFGVVMPGMTDRPLLFERMDRLHASLSAPVALAGRKLPIGVSIGMTVFPADGTDSTKLMKNADLALYEAKRNGRGRWATFRPDQAQALDEQNRLADALRYALSHSEIQVAFQPKRKLRSGGHAGFEALARWHDGTAWVSPLAFVAVAEQTGLITPLGRAVMDVSLERIREIQNMGLNPGRVAVNVTAPQLLNDHFKEETLEALRRNRLRPADLELEVTETVLLGRAAERIDAVLKDFSELGFSLALDDFGTGYASLAHLSRLPINRLKIDRSFVDGIASGGPGAAITKTIISLARSLGMETVAEGVETLEQVSFLEQAGCDAAQGYLYAQPLLTTAEAVAYLRALSQSDDLQKRHFNARAHQRVSSDESSVAPEPQGRVQ